MTPQEWDRHEREFCSTCRYREVGRSGCVIRLTMRQNPGDEPLQNVFRRLGHCSQHSKKEPKPRGRRK